MRHLNRTAQDHGTAKHHLRKAQKNHFADCAERWNKDADDRKCMQEHNRTYDAMISWEKVAKGPRENPHDDAAAKAGKLWEPMIC